MQITISFLTWGKCISGAVSNLSKVTVATKRKPILGSHPTVPPFDPRWNGHTVWGPFLLFWRHQSLYINTRICFLVTTLSWLNSSCIFEVWGLLRREGRGDQLRCTQSSGGHCRSSTGHSTNPWEVRTENGLPLSTLISRACCNVLRRPTFSSHHWCHEGRRWQKL